MHSRKDSQYSSEYSDFKTETEVTDSLMSEDRHRNRTFFDRTFSPIQQGAMRGSIFALLAGAMGTGMFNLPFRLAQIGVVPYFIFILAGAMFSYFGMFYISRCILKYKVQSYSAMAEKASGKWLKRLSEVCLIIYPWGISVCFQVIFAKFVLQLLNDNFEGINFYEDRGSDIYNDTGNMVRIFVTIGAISINMIFILKKSIGILQKLSIIGVVSAVTNLLIILVTMITGFQVKGCTQTLKNQCTYKGLFQLNWGQIKWFEVDNARDLSSLAQGLAAILFCYVNHQLVFPLAFDLKNPTKKRMDKVFNRVHIVEFFVYLLVGFSGYILLIQHQNIFPIAPVVMASIQTTPMSIGKLLMIVSLFFAVPLSIFPAREVTYEAFNIERNKRNHIILSLGLAFSGAAIAVVFQQVNSYFGLLGGTAGVLMAGVIPAVCFYKLLGLRTLTRKLLMAFLILVSVIAAIGAIMSVLDPQ